MGRAEKRGTERAITWGLGMARAGHRHWTAAFLAGVALTGCVEGGKPLAPAGSATTTATTSSTRLVDRDVEAPDVFQVTAQGLWDGRPSLGGVWVATPDAKNPERVLIRNTSNGKFVIGALFKRERENPGPPIQISSDAAVALGLLAGQPAEVNVTALRRDTPPAATPDASKPILDSSETVASETATSETVASETLDTDAVAAAIDKADPAKTAGAAAAGTAATAKGASAAESAGTGEAASDAATAAEPAPKKKWWQRKPKAEAEAPLADAAALESATAAGATAVAPAAVTTAPLAPAATPKATAAPAKGQSLIQLGIFSVEVNAQRAADTVIKAGSPAVVRKETSNGKPYWSVIAGPAGTAAEREALMAKVKSLGFADAYFVSR